MTIEEEIASILRSHDFGWMFKGGNIRVPEPADIRNVLDKIKDKIEEGQEVHFGHLIIRREAGHDDVYVHIGEL